MASLTLTSLPHRQRAKTAMAGALLLHVLLGGYFWLGSARVPVAMSSDNVIAVSLSRADDASVTPASEVPSSVAGGAGAVESQQSAHVKPAASADVAAETTHFPLPPAESRFLAASEMDVRPQPLAPVIVPFPEARLGRPTASAVLILYINASGKVENVEIDRSELPPLFEQAAIDAFLQAPMRPGLKDGRPVKSRTKVLVEFEEK